MTPCPESHRVPTGVHVQYSKQGQNEDVIKRMRRGGVEEIHCREKHTERKYMQRAHTPVL